MHTLEQLYSGELKGTKQLKLSCGLTEFPKEIFSLSESLEVLDLSMNQLSKLPDDFNRLTKLKIAFFSDNLFTELPEALGNCKQLTMIGFKSNQIKTISEKSLPETTRWLILTNNRITELPKSIGKCSKLQKVALAGNQISSLPTEMKNCLNLELLRISANQFQELPEWLLDLPKLSWLAFAGNPFNKEQNISENLVEVDWQEFEAGKILGEGASGQIYKALWKSRNEEVAIKIYKGEVTSDGFPEDEMQASIAAGLHPNLVGLLAKIKNHPQQKMGLVMSLIPPSYYNLGLPPSMESCTRDVFKEGTSFTTEQILKIVTDIASVAKQLHEKGIMHGDLYAHNILVDREANTLMGDFGAATFYNLNDVNAKRIQQIEVRAFGCLLDDLLQMLIPEDKDLKTSRILFELRENLMWEKIQERKLFTEIFMILKEAEKL